MPKLMVFNRDEEYVGSVRSLLSANQSIGFNGEDSLELETLDERIEKGFRILYHDRDLDKFHEYIVHDKIEEKDGDAIINIIRAENSLSETIWDYIEDKRTVGQQASDAVERALESTRWSSGIVDATRPSNINFYRTNARSAIDEIVNEWLMEIETEVIWNPSTRSIERKLNFFNEGGLGEDRGTRLTYNRDIVSIKRKTLPRDVITALYGYGKGRETEGGGHGRAIDFGSINNGKQYVENLEALETWGRVGKDGNKIHTFGKVEYNNINDVEILLERTKDDLDKLSKPAVSYEVEMIDFYRLTGYEHDYVELGDRVNILDRDFTPSLIYKTRVIKIERDLLNKENTSITLGEIVRTLADRASEQESMIENLEQGTTGEGGGPEPIQVSNLSWSTNNEQLEVSTREVEVGSVEIETNSNSSGQGQLMINFISYEDTTVAIKVYDNGVQELYSPILTKITKGNNSIGLPHNYVNKDENSHTFSVTMKSDNGTVYIQPKGVTYNVELNGEYVEPFVFAAEDITIRQQLLESEPTDVYLVGHGEEDDVVILSAPYELGRSYKEEDFEKQWSMNLPGARNLLIEFNGIFRLLEGRQEFSLVTQNRPWVFWINYNDELYGQYGDESSTRELIARDVLQASAVKGWSIEGDTSLDMGLVIAYLKYDGVVAYKSLTGLVDIRDNYAASLTSESIIEEAGQDNTGVQVSRLNDYRLAFTVSGADEIFITERYYVGQSGSTEYAKFNVIPDPWMSIFSAIPVKELPYDTTPVQYTEDNITFTLLAPYEWNIRGSKYEMFEIVENTSGAEVIDYYVDPNNPHSMNVVMSEKVDSGRLVVKANPYNLLGRHVNGTDINLVDEIEVFYIRLSAEKSEYVNIEIGLDSSIFNATLLEDLELNPTETSEFNVSLANSDFLATQVGQEFYEYQRYVTFNLELTPTFEAVKVSDIIS